MSTTSTSTTKLYDLLWEMCDSEVIEDRREYSPEDLAKMYDLTDQESEDLFWLIQSEFEPPENVPPLESLTINQIVGFIEDADHADLDGWDSEHDRIVIRRFLEDVRRGAKFYPKTKEES